MKRNRFLLALFALSSLATAADLPPGVNSADPLLPLGLLDVTQAPYRADPTGRSDSTQAIQRAVNDARDHWLVCFFPEGTYLISDTISCEQQVRKLDRPRQTDGHTQHYWDLPNRIVLFGSTKGKRPMLKLSPAAKGFDNPAKPKLAVHIWAQTRHDAPGKEEPKWGEEWAGISFNHFFRGIDIDVRGHPGAIGIRHSGSQGSALLDATILAEGAYAGLNNCCGQGGGTYNIEVIGGRHAIILEPQSRFPILTGCTFTGQTDAAITYAAGGSQMSALFVGCRIDTDASAAIDFTTQRSYGGATFVDCEVRLGRGGVFARTRKNENLYLENTHVRGPATICPGGAALPASDQWVHVRRYSVHVDAATNLVNGVTSPGEQHDWSVVAAPPDFALIRQRHYQPGPSFEDRDAVNVKAFGAKGDDTTDDTAAFQRAIASHDKIFVPKGKFRVTGTLQLRPNTQLFGLTSTFTSIGSGGPGGRGEMAEVDRPAAKGRGGRRGASAEEEAPFVLATAADPAAAPTLALLSLRGRIDWRSGRGTLFLARGTLAVSGHGGGRLYGVMGMGRPFILSGLNQPISFYALNIERVGTNPQSEIRDCAHVRIFFFKVEAGTLQRENAGDNNTPGRIARSRDVRIYCMAGNVKSLGARPMLEVVDSSAVVVAQLKSFQPGTFPHLTETHAAAQQSIPSAKPVALYVRD